MNIHVHVALLILMMFFAMRVFANAMVVMIIIVMDAVASVIVVIVPTNIVKDVWGMDVNYAVPQIVAGNVYEIWVECVKIVEQNLLLLPRKKIDNSRKSNIKIKMGKILHDNKATINDFKRHMKTSENKCKTRLHIWKTKRTTPPRTELQIKKFEMVKKSATMTKDVELVDRTFKDGFMDDYLTMPDEGTDEENLPVVKDAQYLGTGYLYTSAYQRLNIVDPEEYEKLRNDGKLIEPDD
jgi:hypothetical protein